MSKSKKPFIVAVVMMLVVGCLTGLTITMWGMYAELTSSRETIARLKNELDETRKECEKKISSATRKINEAKSDTKKSEKKIAKYEERIENLWKINAELREDAKENADAIIRSTSVSTTTTPVSAPVVTEEPVATITEAGNEFSDGKCYMDINGTFTEPGSGRVTIRVEFHDAGAPDDYVVTIEGSNGASDNSTWSLTANWDAVSSSLIYKGTKLNNTNGVVTTYDNQTGSLRFDGPDTLYWTDPGTGNSNRGPFKKIS